MQQGVDKQINLGGIVRNTAGSTCPDGEMEEIINLRYKDGSLRPISDNETVPGLDNVEMEYQYITIHTCGYRHWLGVKDGALWYFADQDDDDRVVMKKQAISLCSVSQQQPKYSQAGNLLTVIDGDGIKYVYWKKGAYILSGIDYNGAQTATTVPPFDISFRVTPVTDSAGHQKIRAYSSDAPNTNWYDGKKNDTCDAAKIEQVKEREAAFGTLVNKAVKGIAQDGYAFGYRFACAALQTFDGNWVMQSAPFLIPCGNDKARNRGWTHYKSLYNKLENFAFAPNQGSTQIEKLPSGLYKGKVHISSDISDNKYTYPTWWKTYDHVLGSSGWFSDNDTLSAENKNDRAKRAASPLKYYYLSNNPYATVHNLAKDTVGDYYEYVNDTDFLDKRELLYTLTLNKGDKYTDPGNGKTHDTYTYIGKAEPSNMYPYDLFQPLFERECEYTKNADGKIETLKCYAKYPPTDGSKNRDHSWLVYNRCNGIFGRYTAIVHYDPVKWVRAEDTPYLFGYYVLGSTQYKNHVVNIPLNKLQYRLNHFDQIEKDLYPKFGIFVTKEVYPFKPDDFIESYPLYEKDPHHFEWQYLPSEENNFLNRTFSFYGKYFDTSGTITYVPYERSNKEITDMLFDAERAIFYKIFEEDTDRVKASNGWIDLTPKDTFDWEHLQLLDQLNLDAINRSSFVPQVSYTYNGRLHLANYYENKFNGWPIHSFFDYRTAKECQWESDMVYTCFNELKNDQQSMMGYFDALFGRDGWRNIKSESDLYEYQISVVTEDKEGSYRTLRYTGFTYSNNLYRGLNMLSYPDKRAKQMHITLFRYVGQNVAVWDEYFTLKEHPYWNMAYYLAPDLKPISLRFQNVSYCEGELPRDNDGYITKYNTLNSVDTKTRYPNYIKTSEVNNPLYFPDANTYQVGNVEILALSSNTTDLSTGQVGDAPLYVFAQDGIYGLFVDSSGVMTYSNSRPLARDILNNPFSVTPTDFGVVFTTDRGLMMIAGSQVIEIGQSAEGKYLDFTNANSFDNLPVAASAIDHERLVQLNDYKTDCEFKEYLKGAIIGYNFNEYELWVTNPTKDYTYIFALNQKQWFKRSISCTQYINNYPHLYILDSGKRVSDIDRETTSGNHCFFLTRPIKFDSQSFKQSYRSVVRGLFDLPELKRSSNYTTITLTGDKLKPDVRTIELIEQTKRAIAVEPFETEYRTIELQSVPLTPIMVVDQEDAKIFYDERDMRKVAFYKQYEFVADEMRTFNCADGYTRLLYRYQEVTINSSSEYITLIAAGQKDSQYIVLYDNTGQHQSGVYLIKITSSEAVMSDKISFSNLVLCDSGQNGIEIQKVSDEADIDSVTFDVSSIDDYNYERKYAMWDYRISSRAVFARKHYRNGEELASCIYTYTELATLLMSDGNDYTKYKGATAAQKKAEMQNWLVLNTHTTAYLTAWNLIAGKRVAALLDCGFANPRDVDGETIIKRSGDEGLTRFEDCGMSQQKFVLDPKYMIIKEHITDPDTGETTLEQKKYENLCFADLFYTEWKKVIGSFYREDDKEYEKSFYYIYKDIVDNYRFGFDNGRDAAGLAKPKSISLSKGLYKFIAEDGTDMGYRFLTEDYNGYIYALYDKIKSMPKFNLGIEQEAVNTDTQVSPFAAGEEVIVWLQSENCRSTDKGHAIKYQSVTTRFSYDAFEQYIDKFEKAETVEPISFTYNANKCYVVCDDIKGLRWQVVAPEDATLSYTELMSVIDTWQRWYERIEDSIELSGNECYSISYRVGNVTGDDSYIAQHSFKYIGVGAGETADTTVADIILALDTNDPDFAAIPSYCPEMVELTSGEYIRIETTAGTTYEAHYTGGSGAVDTATLILDIANNKYTVQQTKDQEGVLSNDVLTMTSGESVQFTDLDGNTYNFTYTGDNTITYENLLYNIKIAEKYAMLDDFGDTSISIVQNECIELIVKYASGTEEQYSFQYLDSKNPITLSQLLERINGGSASIGKIPTIDPLYKIYLPINKIISFTDVDGKEYFIKIIPQGRKSKVAGFYVTYSELMQVLSKYDNPNDNEGRFYFYNNHYWYRVTSAVSGYRAGIYVFGSYDCRKWKFIGGNEVGDIDGRGSQVPNAIENINGEDNILFRDLGTLTERIDCKYFRICFVGQLLPESSIEYIDMSVESRLLGGKLR